MHDSLDDELIVAGDIEDRAAGTRVGELDEWLIAQRVLQGRGGNVRVWSVCSTPTHVTVLQTVVHRCGGLRHVPM